MKHKLSSLLVLFAMVAIMLNSCDSSRVYDTYRTIPQGMWHTDSVQVFSFTIDNSGQNHTIFVNIRNDRSYEFSNLWLFINIIPPEGEQITDTIQIVLADPSGRWLGEGFTGVYLNKVPYRTQIYFPFEGEYIIKIQHGMRPRVLKGLTDIGIRVAKI
jgi:gliding motility-associated lipoprotein GldH